MPEPTPAKQPTLEYLNDEHRDAQWNDLRAWARDIDPTWREAEAVADVCGVDELWRLRILCFELLRAKRGMRETAAKLAIRQGH